MENQPTPEDADKYQGPSIKPPEVTAGGNTYVSAGLSAIVIDAAFLNKDEPEQE